MSLTKGTLYKFLNKTGEIWWCRYALMCGSERELLIALPESFPELYDPDQLLTVRLSERMRK